jgi:DNA polymerase (family 10)
LGGLGAEHVENIEIARAFERVAALLELEGANPFRVRAYENAARVIAEHGEPLQRLVEEDADLTAIQGIGKDIAARIRELVREGSLELLSDLERDVPPTLLELTRLPGFGPKRTRKVWRSLGVTTLGELERAAKDGRLAHLEGFGEKTQGKVLEGIARLASRERRFRLSDADAYVRPLLAYMREAPGIRRLEAAGSFRRRRETIGDIDLLAFAHDPAAAMAHFTNWEKVATVEGAGDTRGTVVLRSGLQVPARSYGAALVYFTGSKAHNIRLRKRAIERGLKVSEYGVFEEGGDGEGKWIAGVEEADVYEALGLPWIAPELREDRGEIEAAEHGRLPRLIESEDIRGDLQMHSTWSDGKASLEAMVTACEKLGYEYMAITDHSKSLAVTGGLDADKLRRQWQEIVEVAARHPALRILRGMEVDILKDGTLDLEDEMLDRLDVVVVSVHSHFDLSEKEQTARVLKALQHPAATILAHPTGRLIGERDPFPIDMEEVLACAAENGVAVEINAQPERLDLRDAHAMRAAELGVKLVVNTDAHSEANLHVMHYGIEQARRAWLGPGEVLNTLPLDRLVASLR